MEINLGLFLLGLVILGVAIILKDLLKLMTSGSKRFLNKERHRCFGTYLELDEEGYVVVKCSPKRAPLDDYI